MQRMRPMIRHANPRPAIRYPTQGRCPAEARPRSLVLFLAGRRRLVLRRALRDQRVAFTDIAAAVLFDGHDHLAAFAEWVRHASGVRERDRRATSAVLDAEVKRRA